MNRPLRLSCAAALLALTVPARADIPYVEETARLTLSSGRVVDLVVRVPSEAPPPWPALLVMGGFRTAPYVLDYVDAQHPAVLATFDYPYDPPRRFRFPHSLCRLPAVRQGIADGFEAAGASLQYLQQRPDVEAHRVTLLGASLGAPFVTVAGARYDAPALVLVQGFGEVRQVIEHLMTRRSVQRRGEWIRRPVRWLVRFAAWYARIPDPEDYAEALHSGQRVLMITAEDDQTIPGSATESLWRALQRGEASAERIDLPGGHLVANERDAQLQEITPRVVRWLELEGLL